jgi:hypothetical protein
VSDKEISAVRSLTGDHVGPNLPINGVLRACSNAFRVTASIGLPASAQVCLAALASSAFDCRRHQRLQNR